MISCKVILILRKLFLDLLNLFLNLFISSQLFFYDFCMFLIVNLQKGKINTSSKGLVEFNKELTQLGAVEVKIAEPLRVTTTPNAPFLS